MSEPGKAVFLSYASQDAEAAKRIADALRAAGVEVWFDQNELVGGDAWDTKIRKQIGSCALFVPIISANSQARAEGYFRLEWKLADRRTDLIGKSKAFLLPVCIDDTRDSDADVPDSFLTVQWTKAPGGEVSPAFAARVQRLLTGEATARSARPAATPAAAIPRRHAVSTGWILAGSVAVVLGTLALWQPWRSEPSAPIAASATPAGAVAVSEARKLSQRALGLVTDPNYTRESVWLADELCSRALALDATDAEVWATAAFVGQTMWQHVYDSSDARRQKSRTQADRAVQLDPNSILARLAVARNFSIAGDNAEAARLLRELGTESPDHPWVWQNFSWISRRLDREADVAEALSRLRAGNHRPALMQALFLESRDLRSRARYAESEKILDELLVDPPLRHAYYEKFNLLTRAWYDLPEAEPFIETIPMRFQQEPAFGSGIAQYWLRRGDPEKALQALARVPQDFFEEYAAREPKAFLTGWAHAQAGRQSAAQAEWRSALELVEARLKENPRDLRLLGLKAQMLGLTGQSDAARESWKLRVEFTDASSPPSAENVAAFHTAVRDDEKAILAVVERWPKTTPNARSSLMWSLRYSPWFAQIRDDARIQKLIAEQQAFLEDLRRKSHPSTALPAAAPWADEKSVAVLAFANLSDDKNNEYFSDGISEELLNVLAKVPGLKVTARTSAFHFKGKDTPIPEIARQLGVAYVVEGSVRKAGDKVRITAQLIKAADGFHVWSETFTRDIKDVFAVQDEIAGLIAKNLSLKLGTSASKNAASVNPKAFELYVQARQSWSLRTPDGFVRAEQMLNRALELSPDFVRARAALLDVVQMRSFRERRAGTYGLRNLPELDQRLAEIRAVLTVDPDLAEVYSTLGQTLDAKWQREEAGRAYRRATELNPNYATGRHWYGMHLAELGYMDEALAEVKAASELDPFSFIILDNYGWLLNLAGRNREAVQMLDRAAALNPGFDQTARAKATALFALGRIDEARAIARSVRNNQRELDIWTLGLVGLTDEAKAKLQQMEPGDITNRFSALLAAGQREAALDALANPSGASKGDVVDLLYQRIVDPVRNDPRFIQYLSVLGVTEAHARVQAWRREHPPENPEVKP